MANFLYESAYYGTVGLGEPYLMHHGVKGQKWGVRRYQYENGLLTPLGRKRLGFSEKSLSSKRKIKKALNRGDDLLADTEYSRRKSSMREQKYANKEARLEKKIAKRKNGATFADLRRQKKLQKYINDEKQIQAATERTRKEVQSLINKTIKYANKQGYTVKSKDVLKYAEEGKAMAAQYIGGIGAQLVSRAAHRNAMVAGKSYKVTNTKQGQKATYTHKTRNGILKNR